MVGGSSAWFFKVNSDVACLDGDVGIGAIVRDKNGDVMKAMESHLFMRGYVVFFEVIVIFDRLSKALEASSPPLWVKTIPRFFGTLWMGMLDT